jgi:hypothetical protein
MAASLPCTFQRGCVPTPTVMCWMSLKRRTKTQVSKTPDNFH